MKKLFLLSFISVFVLFISTGCVRKDDMEGIDIITSNYPIEYLTNEMYGKNSKVDNIYPDGENTEEYKFNDKQISMFSEKDLFIYNGDNSSDIASKLSNKNNSILLIDATRGMNPTYGIEEYWLDPSNMLMMALNIKKGLEEYVNNNYLIEDINKNYQELKVNLSELDAKYKLSVENAKSNTIVVADESLQFLEKYNINVIVLNEETLEKTYNQVAYMIKNKEIKNIYLFDKEAITDETKNLISEYKPNVIELNKLDHITDNQRENDKDYISIMNDNLDLIKTELYK